MILDTDVLIDLLREEPEAEAGLHGLPTAPSVSGMAALEALFGSQTKAELRRVIAYLRAFPILWPSEADAAAASGMAAYSLSDGTDLIDAMSAAIALRHGLLLATYNIKHFRPISGLPILQPYRRNVRH